MDKLLPCPFCGGEAETFEASEDSFSILCTGCGVETPYLPYLTEAIAAWNRRADHLPDATKMVTNADRIRSMSDEELAKEMLFFVPSDFKKHYTGLSGGYFATADEAIQASLDWLRQPAKEEHRETD